MLQIKPFRALRFTPRAGELSTLCCPPYDIISDEQRQAYLASNPHNIIRLELPREGENPYQRAGEVLKNWLGDGILRQDDRAGIYLYEEEFTVKGETRRVKGFVSLVKLEEFSKGVVLPHEETLSKAKTDRFNLMSSTFCNFSQIYSIYFDENRSVSGIIDRLSSGSPELSFTAGDGVTHRLWSVYDEAEITSIAALMAEKKAYIADGHHRYETALAFRDHLRETKNIPEIHPANYVMMMLVNIEHEGLVVFPTHRIVKNLTQFDEAGVLRACAPYFETEEKDGDMETCLEENASLGKKSFALYTGKAHWFLLTLKNGGMMDELLPLSSPAYKNLDVSILHTLVLERIFGIDKENMANQQNLLYTRDIAQAMAAVDGGEANCAFVISPTRVGEIAAVAAAQEKMPQKSTYFYPKLITGLVMNRLE